MNTVRALDDNSRCSFHFIVEYNSNNKAWFLKYQRKSNKDNENDFFNHCNHLPIAPEHVPCPKQHVPEEVINFIDKSISLYHQASHIKIP